MFFALCLIMDDPSAESPNAEHEHENVIPVNVAGCEVDDGHACPEDNTDHDDHYNEADSKSDEGVCGCAFGWHA